MQAQLRNICTALAAVLAAASASAATIVTEPFTGGLSGWTNNTSPHKWISTNNVLRLTIAAGMPPLPQTAAIEGGPAASGANFVGDFTAAGIEAVGFSFLCETVVPQDLKLELTSGTNIIFQELSDRLTGTGTWNHFICPLTGPAATRWVGFSIDQYGAVLTNITRVAIRVLNNSSAGAQHYQLDDIFLDRLPTATSLAIASTNSAPVSWANLRTNFTYRMEVTDSPTNNWTALSNFTATNFTHQLLHTNSGSPFFYRLFAP